MKWLTILVIWLLCTGIVAEGTDDWPVFQHDPQHTGFSSSTMPTSLRKVWTAGEPWVSGGLANFVISEGRIFTARYRSLSAFDMNTGSELWNQERHHSPSFPAVKNGRIYLSEFQKVVCLDTDTGDIVWEQVVELLDFNSSPIVIGNHVFVGGGIPAENIVWTEESVEVLKRARKYSHRLLCLDARTGEICWEYYTSDIVDTTPAYLNGRIYINDGFRTVYCLDAETGDTLWWTTIEWTNFSSVSLDGERIFVGTSDGVICLDLETGQILWKSRCEGYILQTPAVAYNKVFVGSFDGVFYCMDAKNGDIIWKIELEDKIPKSDRIISCSAAIADGKVAFGTGSGVLYIVDAESGKIYERSQLDETWVSTLALSEGRLFVGQSNGKITCFEGLAPRELSSSVFIGIAIALFFVALLLVLWIRTRRR
jgi:outer membrane protein assembly factor BamB